MTSANSHPESSDRQLRGVWLWLVRIGFPLLALAALGMFAAGIPVEIARVQESILGMDFEKDDAGNIVISI